MGDSVVIEGLTNATQYNCQPGTVTGRNQSTGRYLVQLDPSVAVALLSVRSANLCHFGSVIISDPTLTPPSTGLGGPLGRSGQGTCRIPPGSTYGGMEHIPASSLPSLHSKDADFLNEKWKPRIAKFTLVACPLDGSKKGILLR